MADTNNNKPKFQLRSSPSFNGADKLPSPAPKLLINHGKPNFTIQRSNSKINGQSNGNEAALPPNGQVAHSKNDNYSPYKTVSPKVVPNTLILPEVKSHSADNNEWVVLRRPKVADAPAPEAGDDNVPEFILRQRRIQERLAKENLDFENRRSGYFTHMVISPTSQNRTPLIETMASPAVVPALEIPLKKEREDKQECTEELRQAAVEQEGARIDVQEQTVAASKPLIENAEQPLETKVEVAVSPAVEAATNGHGCPSTAEEEEVQKAIDEVNKAVAGEEEDLETEKHEVQQDGTAELEKKAEDIVHSVVHEAEVAVQENGHNATKQNGHIDEENYLQNQAKQNGHNGPSIPAPDPSDALGVNYKPKTVVSFSKDLGIEVNKYPDTVKVEKEGDSTEAGDEELQKLAKLKFDIKGESEQEVQVTPVLRED